MSGKSAPSGRVAKETILVVEDDLGLQNSLRRYLKRSRRVLAASTCAEAFELIEEHDIDVMLVDIVLPDGQGFELADRVARNNPRPGVIIMTGDGRMDNAIAALHHGAADFLLKPFSFEALDAAVMRVCGGQSEPAPSSATRRLDVDEWRAMFAPEIVGSDPKMLEVLRVVQRVADAEASVLITGESGTGKELIARALRTGGRRHDCAFVVVNCAAIPANLLESELFGHVRGAFTGATNDRMGCFSSADGGTIFLDEIGELPVGLQAKILRVLQEKQVTPVGGSRSQKVDVRIVAATNRDLEEMVESGQFREDLLYRLNVIQIELPPLRERRADIPQLVAGFIDRCNTRRDRAIDGISDEAMSLLTAFDWPGNIRQLENSLERMVVLRSEGRLEVADLPPKVQKVKPVGAYSVWAPPLGADGVDLQQAVETFENGLILQALERTGNNKNQAAKLLRLNRTTLVEKLKRKKLVVPGPRSGSGRPPAS